MALMDICPCNGLTVTDIEIAIAAGAGPNISIPPSVGSAARAMRASARAVASAFVALESLMNRQPSMSATSSCRCARPGNVAMAAATALSLIDASPATMTETAV